MGSFEQFPEEGLQHAHAVVLEILGEMGVVTRHKGDPLGFGQPDAPQPQHSGVDHMDEVRLERIDRF